MRTIIAALAVALLSTALAAPGALATPTEVNVRIEGRSETLFEGPILVEGHNVKASSDKNAPKGGRRCDGLNNGQHPTPGPTPTASAVDAMSLLGRDFDGLWYPQYEDYFIKRWGPDGQDEGQGEFWGVVVNNVFTSIGGCQYQLTEGDEILWVYDAFKTKPRLGLYPADYGGDAQVLTATAELDQPFEVEVDSWEGAEGAPPDAPDRTGSDPLAGADIAPVTVGAGGFERIDASSPATVKTDTNGLAKITFTEPGWHRIKATVVGSGGKENAVRSNRLDVCVPEPGEIDCGPPPPDDLVRGPAWIPGESEDVVPDPVDVAPSLIAPNPSLPAEPHGSGRVRVELPHLDRRRIARGLVGVSWRVLDPGVGIGKWTISSRRLGQKGARYVTRAKGANGTSATLRLPLGAAHQLRITITDVLGRSSTAVIGKVQVPA